MEGTSLVLPLRNPVARDLSESGELLDLEMMSKLSPPVNPDGKRISDDFDDCEPDWVKVEKRSHELLKISPDLRVAAYYLAAVLRTQGLVGFAQGLDVFVSLMANVENQAYPKFDAADSAVERWYTIGALGTQYKKDGDLLRIVEGLRAINLVKVDGITYSYRDVVTARTKSGGADVATLEKIKKAWGQLPNQLRGETGNALSNAIYRTIEIERLMKEQVAEEYLPSGAGHAPLQSLLKELREMAEFLGETVVEKKNKTPAVEAISAVPGEIRTREDAIRMLRMVSEFYKKTEPSSPVPYLVDRTIKLVDQNFLALLNDLAPDAVEKFQVLAGLGK
ncbi:MAG: type VI secretion system ImpA family N-terminal domain-containing protein [Verrucomicrobia bacterium]|nr:type VI secretion system ImpA family N-terminal domain-containing protein [Verrucomicrobiota bacterium]